MWSEKRAKSVFWNKRKREVQAQKEQMNSKLNLFDNFSNLQFTFTILALRGLDHSRAEAGKIIAYVYYDILAESFFENKEDREIIKITSYMRDSALKKLDEGGIPQYRTYVSENQNDLSQQHLSHDGVARFLSENELFAKVLFYKLQKLSHELINSLASRQLDGLSQQLSGLLQDEELWQCLQEPFNVDKIVCQACHASDRFEDLNVRKNSIFYMFKTDERQTKDDLEIFSLLCFKCGYITEFSLDPYNFSQNAVEGIEYFRDFPSSKVIAHRIYEDAVKLGHDSAKEKIWEMLSLD